MNRNVESHFATTANVDIRRSTFDRSQDIKFTFNVGDIVPFYVDQTVLPGDTFKIRTSKVVRMQTLLTPVMDNLYLDTYFFFVPYRLVWYHWKEFMGENTESAWIPETQYSVPQLRFTYTSSGATIKDCRVKPGDIADYMGVPPNVPFDIKSLEEGETYEDDKRFSVSALPWRAYQLIVSEWFRDQNLVDPPLINNGDTDTYYSDEDAVDDYYLAQRKCYKAARYHDYFSSCLPMPLAALNPVLAPVSPTSGKAIPVDSVSTVHNHASAIAIGSGNTWAGSVVRKDSDGALTSGLSSAAGTSLTYSNLAVLPTSLGINIMELRNAFQVQKYLEASARGGRRYIESIKAHFGVTCPDSRLQRPEYLGGNRIPISIHQITNNSQNTSDDSFLGDLGGMSLTTDNHSDFVQSFTEHGCIIGVCVARYDNTFAQGCERSWFRKNIYDFYFPEFQALSEQAVLNREIYCTGDPTQDEGVFGYNEAWADYRFSMNRLAGEMRPQVSNSLSSWHFGDYYEELPHLDEEWIATDSAPVDRTLAVTSELANQLFADIYVQNFCTRPMPVRSIPGLADHF